ncbi:hypothetical protein [Thiofilum flexile]|uniref:hypothetical protein n=1 Tax=Thiofilum flexile TaxID=125627 RepID=UPI00037CA70D|nr:hypothetical protein [Thiofilum flexile]
MLASPYVMTFAPDFLANNPHLPQQAKVLELAYTRNAVDSERLQGMGEVLWQALDADTQTTLKARKQAAGLNPLPLIIESGQSLEPCYINRG